MNVEKWQSKWNKLFERVRLRWVTELSPKAFAFIKEIEILYAEQYGGECVLYFKSMNRKHRIELEHTHRSTPYITIIRGFDYSILDNHNSMNRLHYKYPFEEKDAPLVMEFFLAVAEELQEIVKGMSKEKRQKDAEEAEGKLVGLTIVSVDKKRQTAKLSDGTMILLHSVFSEIEENSTKEILNGLE
jgi:hypothetical protein